MPNGSDLERAFDTLWRVLGGPDLVAEYRPFADRRWRLDRALPARRIGIELQGGGWLPGGGGRHHRPTGYDADCEKYNALQMAGWRVFLITTTMLRDDPASVLQPMIDLVNHD